MFRIAHVSDLHVLSPLGFEWRKAIFNKRITGYANLLLKRKRVFRRDLLVAALEAAAAAADHVVVTGDITNLSLESEYEEARTLLDEVARRVEVTVVPGNHDVYLRTIHHERRFPHHFGTFLKSDLPELALELASGAFPCMKLRGPAAIIALSSAVPRPPFVAAGLVGDPQLAALGKALRHPEVARRTPVVLLHHPPVDDRPTRKQKRDGLVDGAELRETLGALARGLVLFGHLHMRTHRTLPTSTGALDIVSSSGGALDHDDPMIRSGFNMYEIDDDGRIATIEAHVLDETGKRTRRVEIGKS
ncbi:MAG: metallophosphoesterase [Acidobacteria bacterium]|nr:metallophosphoesterase [Acidobacteriota bacterium]